MTRDPMLEAVTIRRWLARADESLDFVSCSGDSGPAAGTGYPRACLDDHAAFKFRQTWARCIKDGRIDTLERRLQGVQARKASIGSQPDKALCLEATRQQSGPSSLGASFHGGLPRHLV